MITLIDAMVRGTRGITMVRIADTARSLTISITGLNRKLICIVVNVNNIKICYIYNNMYGRQL